MSQHTQALTEFLAGLHYEQIPEPVLARTEDLFLDWLGSTLASAGAHPIPLFERYAAKMGPADGPARILINGKGSSAFFAALVNAASSHLVEQDDLHNSSVLHPATVVFPAALAAAQDLGKSGRELLVASVAGYEAGIRIGEFLGRSHYRIFHTTATVGTLAAAVAVGKLTPDDYERMYGEVDSKLQSHEHVGIYADAQDLAGVTPSGLAKDLASAFGRLGEFRRFPRGAVVTDRPWWRRVTLLSNALLRSIEVLEEGVGADHPSTLESRRLLSQFYTDRGSPDAAAQYHVSGGRRFVPY